MKKRFLFVLALFLIQSNLFCRDNDVKIWYLGHCGYAIKTANHLLIFDYIELEENPIKRGLDKGFIDPAEIKDLNVCVFVTHSHIDHFDKIIFSWEKQTKNIRYFLGWNGNFGEDCYYMQGPREELILNDIEIYTINSHHSGVNEVAYLVNVDGLWIYHGGDYQGKMERGGVSNVVEDMKYLNTKTDYVDLFFVGAWTGDPLLNSIKGLKQNVIFPMHDRNKEEKYKTFAEEIKERGIEIPVICPKKRGDSYMYSNGKINTIDGM